MPCSWILTQHTSLKNKHQRCPEAQFPQTTHHSIWNCPLMRVACHTCQCRCIGSCLYASDMLDFHRSLGLIPGFFHITTWMFAPKSERLLSTMNPPSVRMSELSNLRLALWSLTSCSLADPFFGMVNMGWATIPGSSSDLKACEYCLRVISVSHWDFRKCCNASSSVSMLWGHEMLPWGILSGLIVSAKGQNLDLSPWHIEWMSSELGWWPKSSLRWSALVGVMIEKRWG